MVARAGREEQPRSNRWREGKEMHEIIIKNNERGEKGEGRIFRMLPSSMQI